MALYWLILSGKLDCPVGHLGTNYDGMCPSSTSTLCLPSTVISSPYNPRSFMAVASRLIQSSARQAIVPFHEMSGRRGFIWHDLHASHRARARAGNLGSSTAYHLHLSLSKLSSSRNHVSRLRVRQGASCWSHIETLGLTGRLVIQSASLTRCATRTSSLRRPQRASRQPGYQRRPARVRQSLGASAWIPLRMPDLSHVIDPISDCYTLTAASSAMLRPARVVSSSVLTRERLRVLLSPTRCAHESNHLSCRFDAAAETCLALSTTELREGQFAPKRCTASIPWRAAADLIRLRCALILSQIHYISPSIRCCGAGTAADTEFTTALISSNVELHALSTGRKPRVATAMTMLKQMLYRSA